MIVESAQILCTALHLNGRTSAELYRRAYAAHPVVRWAAQAPPSTVARARRPRQRAGS